MIIKFMHINQGRRPHTLRVKTSDEEISINWNAYLLPTFNKLIVNLLNIKNGIPNRIYVVIIIDKDLKKDLEYTLKSFVKYDAFYKGYVSVGDYTAEVV